MTILLLWVFQAFRHLSYTHFEFHTFD